MSNEECVILIWCPPLRENRYICLFPSKETHFFGCSPVFPSYCSAMQSRCASRGVAVFLDQQLTYEAVGKGRWPGRQRSHGDTGYVEFVLELLGGEQRLLDA